MSASPNLNADDPILRMPDVQYQVGLSKSTIYALIKKGEFPKQICIGNRARGWLRSEINRWKQERIAQSFRVDP